MLSRCRLPSVDSEWEAKEARKRSVLFFFHFFFQPTTRVLPWFGSLEGMPLPRLAIFTSLFGSIWFCFVFFHVWQAFLLGPRPSACSRAYRRERRRPIRALTRHPHAAASYILHGQPRFRLPRLLGYTYCTTCMIRYLERVVFLCIFYSSKYFS